MLKALAAYKNMNDWRTLQWDDQLDRLSSFCCSSKTLNFPLILFSIFVLLVRHFKKSREHLSSRWINVFCYHIIAVITTHSTHIIHYSEQLPNMKQ